ncbi:MAG: hypothetical protein HUJ62_02715 [Streptococcus gallolyticus]|nr:hypothetical protein [Streptococcus gallolyticus]
MEVTNRGYINFNNDYNKHTQEYTTASMSFSNGKDEAGEYKHGYIKVIAYGELGHVLYDNVDNLVTISGRYRQGEYKGKKYAQVIVTAINGYAPAQNQNNSNNGNFGNNQRSQRQGNFQKQGNFQNSQPQNFRNQQQNPNSGYQNNGNFGQNQGQQTSFFQGQTTQANPDFSRGSQPMDISEEDLPF